MTTETLVERGLKLVQTHKGEEAYRRGLAALEAMEDRDAAAALAVQIATGQIAEVLRQSGGCRLCNPQIRRVQG